ncbi:MAG TPA: hypothetical protein VFR37_02305 [Longimicrobium sp.]|nr:hypothetical protein [Longimicrobium sp.]
MPLHRLQCATPPGPTINPADPGSAVEMFDRHPDRRHPAEVVVGALLRARAVDLGDNHCYRLGADLSLGRVGIGPGDDTGFVVTHEMTVGEFLRLCSRLSFNEACEIARGRTCDVEARRAAARLARARTETEPD